MDEQDAQVARPEVGGPARGRGDRRPARHSRRANRGRRRKEEGEGKGEGDLLCQQVSEGASEAARVGVILEKEI